MKSTQVLLVIPLMVAFTLAKPMGVVDTRVAICPANTDATVNQTPLIDPSLNSPQVDLTHKLYPQFTSQFQYYLQQEKLRDAMIQAEHNRIADLYLSGKVVEEWHYDKPEKGK